MKIIAESAFNHQGDLNYLLKMALASKKSGADYFTVQIFKTEDFCTKDYSKFQICKDCELSSEEWNLLLDYCEEISLNIIPCVLDEFSFNLVKPREYKLIKIHATDILNVALLEYISKNFDGKIILETQCSTKRDINIAVNILKDKIEAIFHGFSNYPTDYEDLNLNALDSIEREWGYKTGLADHSLDVTEIPLIALAKNVSYLEKHITLSRRDRQYDYQVSLIPEEFAMMVQQVNKYKKVFGERYKHPVENELKYRDIIFKKHTNEVTPRCVRSDYGQDYFDKKYSNYDKDRVVIAVIARLKSVRFPKKVLKPLLNDLLVFDLMNRLHISTEAFKTVLATSYLEEDKLLVDECVKRGLPHYAGDPISVTDRLLDIIELEKASAVIRVTGDNPLTDPMLIDKMIKLYREDNLDYVRVNNLPFGVTAELFSSKYLMKLYQANDPRQSEYLTWFVMKDDQALKGCIDIEFGNQDLKRVGYSVDYMADYVRVLNLIKKTKKNNFTDITLTDIVENVNYSELINLEDTLKLPHGEQISFAQYFKILEEMKYKVRMKFKI